MDLVQFLTELLQKTNPGAVAWIAAAAAGTKFGVDLVRRFFPQLQGNVVQTVTAGVALAATVVQGAVAGVFANGLDAVELRSLAIVAVITWLGAIGVNEALTNRNKPVPPAPSADELTGRMDRIRG